ncbi:hypothetical protein LSTR_LSTR011768 [Laodelphax striatellus]|uniref:BPL/LPL catalytic domain-containing protein n=1 Tax=Laodelphax striatellus TaxID=195883 RepID=A0A482XMJ3_LAOST|nr:hypothetical protein LSTR_LSTR011768 [Laodelphax striatellus]
MTVDQPIIQCQKMQEITTKLDNILTNSKPASSGKPPNIVVYSEFQSSALCLRETLLLVLEKQRYTVYILNANQMLTAPWLNNVCLLVIAGDVSPDITNRLKSYVIEGNGRLLCFGSNLLEVFVPELSNAEVEDEIGTFTYSKWEHVELFHRVLKYRSSIEQDGFNSITNHIPNKISLPNAKNQLSNFDVTTTGQEENSQTPSFILLTSNSGGKTLFSNAHLEIDAANVQLKGNSSGNCKNFKNNIALSKNQTRTDNIPRVCISSDSCKNQSDPSVNHGDTFENHNVLSKNYNEIRIDIFADLLQKHFGLLCCGERSIIEPDYTVGFLFGDPACKRKFLQDLSSRLSDNGVLKLKKISVKFCVGEMDVTPTPSPTLLPVLVDDECSEFSERLFFEELRTRRLGRLGVFCKVMTSSMHVVDTRLVDGFIVVPRSLTRGVGRGENVWLSPDGCALFSLQIHVTSESQFQGRLGFLQHCVTLAAVLCVRALPGCQQLIVNLKWPNDIYADKTMKIGGAIASSIVSSRDAVCNLGVGVNLFNRLPTTCINDMIDALNARNGSRVQHLTLEKFVAILLNQFEQLIDMVEAGRIDEVIELYYKHWLHSGSKVTVQTADGREEQVTIVGIDKCGFLKVVGANNRQFSVHPDGNSFDMMSGLIAPKVH